MGVVKKFWEHISAKDEPVWQNVAMPYELSGPQKKAPDGANDGEKKERKSEELTLKKDVCFSGVYFEEKAWIKPTNKVFIIPYFCGIPIFHASPAAPFVHTPKHPGY